MTNISISTVSAPNNAWTISVSSWYGKPLSRYKWMHGNHQLSTWEVFICVLELHFGPSSYENHQATLFKLRQVGNVAEYQVAFEKLSNRILGLPSDALLNCSISGLCPKIQRELALHQTFSLSQTLRLAKLIEAKLLDTPTPRRKYTIPQPTPATALLPKPTPFVPFPIRQLSLAEMLARRSKGLRFNYDDKWHAGHKCGAKQFCCFSVMILRT